MASDLSYYDPYTTLPSMAATRMHAAIRRGSSSSLVPLSYLLGEEWCLGIFLRLLREMHVSAITVSSLGTISPGPRLKATVIASNISKNGGMS